MLGRLRCIPRAPVAAASVLATRWVPVGQCCTSPLSPDSRPLVGLNLHLKVYLATVAPTTFASFGTWDFSVKGYVALNVSEV